MTQGQDESDDSYLKRSKASMDALCITGGGHVLTSPDLMKIGGSTPIDKEKQVESEKFLAVLLLLNADSGRYGNLNRELTYSAQLGNDDYPKTSSSTYELLHRRSGGYDNNDRLHRNTRTSGRGFCGGRYGRAF